MDVVALFVATCNFSHEAQAIADLSGVIGTALSRTQKARSRKS
ncbi:MULTISPECIES: hypothetical protein [Streptomyces]|nr:hypothetical protein [Streptomyces galilaeus]